MSPKSVTAGKKKGAGRSYLTQLSKKAQIELFDDLNYLNQAEIKSFCKRHSIPFKIVVEDAKGHRVSTREDDRKGVILERIRTFLKTGRVPEATYFPGSVVCFAPLKENLAESDRLFYGQYDKANHARLQLLRSLTDGEFRDGAIARILARDFWSRGAAPTFAGFAAAWLEATREHTSPNPEWAYLSDRARAANIPDWKNHRAKKAAKALATLERLLAE